MVGCRSRLVTLARVPVALGARATALREDDAAGYDLDVAAFCDFAGRGTDSPATLGFQVCPRDKNVGTERTPQALFTQFGSLYSTAAPFGQNDTSIG